MNLIVSKVLKMVYYKNMITLKQKIIRIRGSLHLIKKALCYARCIGTREVFLSVLDIFFS